MKKDFKEKFVVCRPLGGLNDVLCQIEVCWAYAERYSRTLVLDFSENPMSREFFGLLEPFQPVIPIIVNPGEEFFRKVSKLSVFPPQLKNRLTRYRAVTEKQIDPNARFDDETGVRLEFDLHLDYKEDILVHHRSGGGTASTKSIKRFTLPVTTQDEVATLIPALPKDFSATHVRSTDYSTNYQLVLRKLQRSELGEAVVVCSDSSDVLRAFSAELTSTPVVTFPPFSTPVEGPLHLSAMLQEKSVAEQQALRLLAEILTMGFANRFYYTFVENRSRKTKPNVSGLSQLVAFVVRNRGEIPIWRDSRRLAHWTDQPGETRLVGGFYDCFFFWFRSLTWRSSKKLNRLARRFSR